MAQEPAWYCCVSGAYKIYDFKKENILSVYKNHDIHGNDKEVGEHIEGTWDSDLQTFTFSNGDYIEAED